MSVLDRLIVRGRSVFRMHSAAEASAAGVPDGTLRLYNDGTRQYIQTFSRDTGAWETFNPSALVAPSDVDYLVGTADADLSNEIVVGTTPSGELGGTWGSPTVNATHSGSAHHAESHTHGSHSDVSANQHHNEDHAARHADGGADELDVADLASTGSIGRIPISDGAGGVSWVLPLGDLGGNYNSPTVNANHSGSAHHTRSHDIASTSDHSSTAWRMHYANGSGNVTDLALGSSGTVLTSNGASSAPSFQSAGGAWSLVHSSNSETGPLTSSTDADALVISSLSIPAAHGIKVQFNYRSVNPAGASRTARFGLELNTTEVLAPSAGLLISTTNASTSADGTVTFEVPPAATNYTQGGLGYVTEIASDGATRRDPTMRSFMASAAQPVATRTSITIRYQCVTTSADETDLYITGVRVWELAD